MVWFKAWHCTRTKFLVLLALLAVIATSDVFGWPALEAIVAKVELNGSVEGGVAGKLNEAIAAERTFRGYISNEWFAGTFRSCMVLFAALLGAGSVLSASGRGMLFSLALPVARPRWLAARAVVGLAELLVLALVPSLLIALLASAVNESYSFVDAAVHGALIFVVGSVFFALAMLASAFFDDLWRALLVAIVAAIALTFSDRLFPAGYGLYATMSGSTYHHDGTLPWAGLIASVVLTPALLYAAAAQLARRDF
jgi:ABC-type transport system involved in multi-copper enzyme maturation permease subunit